MRKLNTKQKNIIKKYFEEDLLDITNFNFYENRNELLRKLEDINDYETLYQDLNRLINDLQFKKEDYIDLIKNFK